ncbi:hypothetical protein CU097_011987 [Rhizopus azygosporus]|uniref:Uncharacterized protein n=1 Tax=Rhizopus azygosporus TaxID=86630 RepID=A0A367JLW5_RHIAZ|nr:hypothetical protein CU097_011987 [Rhizopus azygosporus]
MDSFNQCIVNKNIHSLKRKIEDDTIEESHSSKRFHFHKSTNALSSNISNTTSSTAFQLSLSTATNRVNGRDTEKNHEEEEDMMMIEYDSFTDEDESLEVPAAPPLRNYITIVDDDAGYLGTLERGWSDLFMDEVHWNEI